MLLTKVILSFVVSAAALTFAPWAVAHLPIEVLTCGIVVAPVSAAVIGKAIWFPWHERMTTI